MRNRLILWSLVALFIGISLGFWIYRAFFAGIDQGLLLWSYYFFQIMGGIGTCLAVVVALFKDSIRKMIWHPKFKFELQDGGIIEVINHQETNPTADMFKGILRITNDGNDSARRCKISVEKIEFAPPNNTEYDVIHDIEGNRKIDLGTDSGNIPTKKYLELDLYKIIKATGNPQNGENDHHNVEDEKYLIEIAGPQVEDKYRKAGKLRISYCLTYDDDSFRNFILYIEGNGLWKGRKEELKRAIKIKLVEV